MRALPWLAVAALPLALSGSCESSAAWTQVLASSHAVPSRGVKTG